MTLMLDDPTPSEVIDMITALSAVTDGVKSGSIKAIAICCATEEDNRGKSVAYTAGAKHWGAHLIVAIHRALSTLLGSGIVTTSAPPPRLKPIS